jgi:hypothetical protein
MSTLGSTQRRDKRHGELETGSRRTAGTGLCRAESREGLCMNGHKIYAQSIVDCVVPARQVGLIDP